MRNIVVNFGSISKLIFETLDWFLSKSQELGIRKIDQWVQVQSKNGANVISELFLWIMQLKLKVVFNKIMNIIHYTCIISVYTTFSFFS